MPRSPREPDHQPLLLLLPGCSSPPCWGEGESWLSLPAGLASPSSSGGATYLEWGEGWSLHWKLGSWEVRQEVSLEVGRRLNRPRPWLFWEVVLPTAPSPLPFRYQVLPNHGAECLYHIHLPAPTEPSLLITLGLCLPTSRPRQGSPPPRSLPRPLWTAAVFPSSKTRKERKRKGQGKNRIDTVPHARARARPHVTCYPDSKLVARVGRRQRCRVLRALLPSASGSGRGAGTCIR